MPGQRIAGSDGRVIEIVSRVVRHAELLHDAPRAHVPRGRERDDFRQAERCEPERERRARALSRASVAPMIEREPAPSSILDPGFELTLRPMRYPQFYDMYKDAIANTWSVEEIEFSTDLQDLRERLSPAEREGMA